MSLFNWFFPKTAGPGVVRLAKNTKSNSLKTRSVEDRLADIEGHVGFVALVLGSLMERLDANGVVTRSELRDVMDQLDEIDGFQDGRLPVSMLMAEADKGVEDDIEAALENPDEQELS